jgi:ABC-type Mn2+/Zn2+ transport system permease subunit
MLEYGFLTHALLGAILSGISLAVLSPFVTLKKIAYMGEALSHIAFAGIALALLLGLNLSLTTLLFVIGVAILIGFVSRFFRTEETNVITIFLSVAMALGMVLIALKKDYTFDLASYLFGNILLVTASDLWQLGLLACVNLLFVTLLYKELFYLTYNMSVSEVFGIKVKPVYYGLLLLLAVNIVFAVKIAGIILVTAQLILPASIAFRLVRRLRPAIFISIGAAILSSLLGFYFSWQFNLPTGAVIVLVEFVLYIAVLMVKPQQKTNN